MRRLGEPDPDRVLSAFPPEERAMIARWLMVLEKPAEWTDIPGLRVLLPTIAAYTLARASNEPFERAIRDATRALGFPDVGRSTHPAESLVRLVSYWEPTGKLFNGTDPDAP